MSIVGIVAEYNPFHLGHQFHIQRSLDLLGEGSTVVCVMSGDYVQRGEAAVYAKYARAEAACRCGADLVVELPLPWCISSAEGFARGAVSLLAALGCDTLSFGSESGDPESLDALAAALLTPEMNERIRRIVESEPNLSYAAARQSAAAELCGGRAALLSEPNDILAVEYLKTIRSLDLSLRPLAIRRVGSAHDGTGGELRSASELREILRGGGDIAGEVPQAAHAVFTREDALGRRVDPARLEIALLARLRSLTPDAYERLQDASGGLGRRLYRAVMDEPGLDAVTAAAKTKRYALARIRRLLLSAALGLKDGDAAGLPPYARILAAKARGRDYLRGLHGASLPIVTKPAVLREIGGEALRCFELGSAAHDLLVLGFPREEQRRGGQDWRTGPAIL